MIIPSYPKPLGWRAGVQGVLQGARGGEYSGQLCDGVRTDGRGHGLWLPTDDRQQDPARVRTLSLSHDSHYYYYYSLGH